VTAVIILDTDVFSQLSESRPQARRLAPYVSGVKAALAFPSIAELHYGAERARWGDSRIRRLEEDIRGYGLLRVTDELLRLCGRLRDQAARIGHPLAQPIHANDLWIAACAVYYGLPLLTGNTRHFAGMPGLELAT
jgi:tRNA(fMet)-specific endonuclease VapC